LHLIDFDKKVNLRSNPIANPYLKEGVSGAAMPFVVRGTLNPAPAIFRASSLTIMRR
jgi:hypothetical protein